MGTERKTHPHCCSQPASAPAVVFSKWPEAQQHNTTDSLYGGQLGTLHLFLHRCVPVVGHGARTAETTTNNKHDVETTLVTTCVASLLEEWWFSLWLNDVNLHLSICGDVTAQQRCQYSVTRLINFLFDKTYCMVFKEKKEKKTHAEMRHCFGSVSK